MKRLLLPALVTASVLFFAFSSFKGQKRINCTELNGLGCVCHVIEPSPRVMCWVTGPAVLKAGATAYYKMFLTGGPALGGGYNIAVRYGTLDTLAVNDTLSVLVDNELTQKVPLLFPSPQDTIFWLYQYTAPDRLGYDTMYSCGLSTNNDGNPTDADEWAFGPKFPILVVDEILPVELTSFTATPEGAAVRLDWQTASETNNRGFTIERRTEGETVWETGGFVKGAGTSSSGKEYSITVPGSTKKVHFRLRQEDFDGSARYMGMAEADPFKITRAILAGNYPNPFNPQTRIQYELPEQADIVLQLFSANGELLGIIDRGTRSAGRHEAVFDGSSLSSGVYYYQLRVNQTRAATGKMLLIK